MAWSTEGHIILDGDGTYLFAVDSGWGGVNDRRIAERIVEDHNAVLAAGHSSDALEAGAVAGLVELVRFLDNNYAVITYVDKYDSFRCEVCGNETPGERSDIRHSSKCPVPIALAALEPDD